MKCHIAKDLLPNYVDGLVSDETKADIRAHLDSCPDCRLIYEQMSAPVTPQPVRDGKKEINYLKKIKKGTLIKIAAISAAIILVFGMLSFIYAIGAPAASGDVKAETEFQYMEDAYLNREWVIHFKLTNGKALNAKTKLVTEINGDGRSVVTGYIITLYEVQPSSLIMECDNYTVGYFINEDEIQYYHSEDFDFTITVRYKDKDTVYSMREEGLFD